MTTSLLAAINKAMQPLTQKFGMRIISESDSSSWSEVAYVNSTTGLKVAVDWSEFRPFISICELVDGKFPPEPTSIARAKYLKSFDIDDILLIRATDSSPVGKMLGTKSDQAVECLLREYANGLDEYASDVLSGDFTIFSELTIIVKARFEENRAGH